MSDPAELVHPDLYNRLADGALRLNGVQCSACGHVAFPFQTYGCEACGAQSDKLEPLGLEAQGSLISFAKVHRHQGKDIEAPFIIAQIQLDCGVFLRATMTSSDDSGLKPGLRVTGQLAPGSGLNTGKQELRFGQEAN